jgi:hypothetical protein
VGSAREKSKDKEKESGADMKSGGLDMKWSPKGWDRHEVGPGVGHGVGGRVVVAGRRCRGSSGLRRGVAQEEWVMGRGKDTQALGFVWHRLQPAGLDLALHPSTASY